MNVFFWQESDFFFSILCDIAHFEAIKQFEASETIRIFALSQVLPIMPIKQELG